MSTITEIQQAIGRLPANEKSALAAWLQSQEEPIMSEAEEAALLASLDKAAAELDAGKGISIERVREDIREWAKPPRKGSAKLEAEGIEPIAAMGRRARECALTHHQWPQIGRETADIYRALDE